MNEKPKIECPHCKEMIEASSLPPNRKYRNRLGIDVFSCPYCTKNLKIDPYEFVSVKGLMQSGEMPSGIAIEGAKEEDILPCEEAALAYEETEAPDVPDKLDGWDKVIGWGIVTLIAIFLISRCSA